MSRYSIVGRRTLNAGFAFLFRLGSLAGIPQATRFFGDMMSDLDLILSHPYHYSRDEVSKARAAKKAADIIGAEAAAALAGEWKKEYLGQRDCYEAGPMIPQHLWIQWLDGGCKPGELNKKLEAPCS